MIEVIKAVAGAPAHLVGHSLGTLVAQHVAVEAPEWVASLTLFGPIVEPATTARERLRARAQTARHDGLVAVADGVVGAALSSSSRAAPLAIAFLRESHMRQDAEGFAQILRGAGRGGESGLAADPLSGADRDRRRGRRRAAARRAGARRQAEGRAG